MFILFKFVFAAALIFHSSGAAAEQPQTDQTASAAKDAKTDNLPDGAVKLPSGLIVPPPAGKQPRSALRPLGNDPQQTVFP